MQPDPVWWHRKNIWNRDCQTKSTPFCVSFQFYSCWGITWRYYTSRFYWYCITALFLFAHTINPSVCIVHLYIVLYNFLYACMSLAWNHVHGNQRELDYRLFVDCSLLFSPLFGFLVGFGNDCHQKHGISAGTSDFMIRIDLGIDSALIIHHCSLVEVTVDGFGFGYHYPLLRKWVKKDVAMCHAMREPGFLAKRHNSAIWHVKHPIFAWSEADFPTVRLKWNFQS